MGILFYQVGIFIVIQIAAFFGKSSRNVAIILISVFTLLQVYASWLMILQFITIFISYRVSKNLIASKNNTPKKTNNNFGREFNELSKADNVSTKAYGLSARNPILMSSIPSSYRFIDNILEKNGELKYERNGSIKSKNFPKPIDIYKFTSNNQEVTTLYIYPYYNYNIEIIPDILKQKTNN